MITATKIGADNLLPSAIQDLPVQYIRLFSLRYPAVAASSSLVNLNCRPRIWLPKEFVSPLTVVEPSQVHGTLALRSQIAAGN
ncbi:unnamed protein product [Clonostachys rosea f. rosea IK726]|uniref:Uncharacterized protein n=1 Tax=Clonostachys rosea f. rosea IK726 TaxID=1349383 RepID=A0ACA9U129_BIOOC|nr:unnamed protein product [Clonostachys rosea f. rosea IK726]